MWCNEVSCEAESCPAEKISQVLRKCSVQQRQVIISLLSSVRTKMTSCKNYNFSEGKTESHDSCPLSTDCPVYYGVVRAPRSFTYLKASRHVTTMEGSRNKISQDCH